MAVLPCRVMHDDPSDVENDFAELLAGFEVGVGGGWAVDALLGHQTRDHADLDIALPEKFESRLREPARQSWLSRAATQMIHGSAISFLSTNKGARSMFIRIHLILGFFSSLRASPKSTRSPR